MFSLKKNDLDGELPKGFINVSMKKGKWFFSSMELVSTNISGFVVCLYVVLMQPCLAEEDERKDERRTG